MRIQTFRIKSFLIFFKYSVFNGPWAKRLILTPLKSVSLQTKTADCKHDAHNSYLLYFL